MTTSAVHERPEDAIGALMERYDRFPIEVFVPSPLNPRKTFDPVKQGELEASVREKGVEIPLVVREVGNKLEILAGERRYRAAKAVGRTHLPAVVRELSDAQALELMAIENGQRADVLPLEEAAGYKALLGIAKGYTAAMIAAKTGRTEKYIWDRIKLLDLVDEAQELLRAHVIGVEHAEVIAKLKPAEQKRVIARQNGGLFTHQTGLEFAEEIGTTAYSKLKPVTVRELRSWIAHNIRFDLEHAAAAAPLEFGPVAEKVYTFVHEKADAGVKKRVVVPIVLSHMCPSNAQDEKERTYGATAWKKAAGKDGQPTCDHAVMGLVVAGEDQGESFLVCIARDKCRTHWRESVDAKEKAAQQRAKGDTKKAAKVEKKAEESYDQKWKRQQAEQAARQKAWDLLEPHLMAEAAAQVKKITKLTAQHATYLLSEELQFNRDEMTKHLGAKWYEKPVAALLITAAHTFYGSDFSEYVKQVAKPLGLDIKRLEAVRDQHQPKATAPAPKKKAS